MVEGIRHAVITGDDHGALLAMTAWFLVCALILCSAMRAGVHFSTRHMPNVDNWLILTATIFAIGGTVTISLAVNCGLGRRIALLSSVNIEDLQRFVYAATILYVLTVGVSKLAITTFLSRLACTSGNKNAVILLGGLAVCWTIAITAGVVFQCDLPRPWQTLTGKCIPMFPFWLSAGIVDIVSDFIMIILPFYIVSGLQLPTRKKAVVMFIFALRLILMALSTTRLVYLHYLLHSSDPSFYSVPYFTLTQAHAIFSVIIACSPALKPFMDNVRTGMLSISLATHCPNTYYGQASYNMQTFTKNSSSSKSKSRSEAPSDDPRILHSGASHAAAAFPQFDYVPNEQGRIIAQQRVARPVLPPAPSSEMVLKGRSRRLSRCPSTLPTSASSRSRTRTPTRPPPPPEELRPDLSLFRSPAGSKCTVGSGTGGGDADKVFGGSTLSGDRGSEESMDSRRGIITKTQGWDVRYDDYHGA